MLSLTAMGLGGNVTAHNLNTLSIRTVHFVDHHHFG
jgi:hypothetical protein